MLTASELVKDYPGHGRVLSGVDVAVPDGEFLAVMGPSGSGKSTLLHLLSGMDRPTSGSVRLEGQDLGSLGEKKLAALRLQRVGFVFQQPRMLAALSLKDNVVLPALLAGARRARWSRGGLMSSLSRWGWRRWPTTGPVRSPGASCNGPHFAGPLSTTPGSSWVMSPRGR